MKQFFTAILMIVSVALVQAQIETPAASPKAMTMQTVGLTDITVEYSRPAVKGRTIFAADGLVPYGKVWRTGANAVTKMSTDGPINVAGADLAAGDYAILTMPGEKDWNVHFYTYDTWRWSNYLEVEPAAVVTVKSMKSPAMIENFTIEFTHLDGGNAHMEVKWANTMVALPITTPVDDVVMKQIDKVMAGPTPGDYYSAASYYHTSGKDLNKALEMITVATDVAEPKYWQVRRKALILADLGKTKDAIKTATMSKELAMKAGNDDYVRLNENSISEWSKM